MKAMLGQGRVLTLLVFAAVLGTVFTTILTTGVAGQDEDWQIVRAEYGFRSQHTDVTDLIVDLVSRGGVNGRVSVSNQTMGGDPAIGKDKTLRIFARNRRREDREFDFPEGSFVDVNMFRVRMDSDDWGDHDRNRDRDRDRNDRPDRDRDRGDSNGLRILRGFYGVQGRTANVTELLRRMTRDGILTVHVDNNALGGDPAIGADKMLIVFYLYQGKEQAVAVGEGVTLTIP